MIRWNSHHWFALLMTIAVSSAAQSQQQFTAISPAFENGGTLPDALKCSRDGGSGESPPLNWSSIPEGSKSLALIMHHYPRGTTEGVDAPSQYWLLWNIPVEATGIERGNALSIGTEGSDKDGRRTGYTPPCSPSGQHHKYTVTVYALDKLLDSLPIDDDRSVDWATMTDAMQGKVIDQSSIVFYN